MEKKSRCWAIVSINHFLLLTRLIIGNYNHGSWPDVDMVVKFLDDYRSKDNNAKERELLCTILMHGSDGLFEPTMSERWGRLSHRTHATSKRSAAVFIMKESTIACCWTYNIRYSRQRWAATPGQTGGQLFYWRQRVAVKAESTAVAPMYWHKGQLDLVVGLVSSAVPDSRVISAMYRAIKWTQHFAFEYA